MNETELLSMAAKFDAIGMKKVVSIVSAKFNVVALDSEMKRILNSFAVADALRHRATFTEDG